MRAMIISIDWYYYQMQAFVHKEKRTVYHNTAMQCEKKMNNYYNGTFDTAPSNGIDIRFLVDCFDIVL